MSVPPFHPQDSGFASTTLNRAVDAMRRTASATVVPADLTARVKAFDDRPVRNGITCERTRSSRGGIQRLLSIAISLAVLGAVVVIAHGTFSRHSVAFAQVVEQVRQIKAVRFRGSTNWLGVASDEVWIESDTGVARVEDERNKTVNIFDVEAGKGLFLDSRAHTALFLGLPRADDEAEKCGLLATFRDDIAGIEAVRRERVDGVDAQVFEVRRGTRTNTYWVDPQTRLPVRYRSQSKIMGTECTQTFDHFEWNVDVDPGLLALEAPPGYRSRGPARPVAAKEATAVATPIVEMLSRYARATEGRLPDSLSGIEANLEAISTAVGGVIKEKENVNEALAETIGTTMGEFFGVQIGLGLGGSSLHYLGKGRSLNDGKGIVAWYKHGEKVTAIFDDLSVRQVDEGDLPKE